MEMPFHLKYSTWGGNLQWSDGGISDGWMGEVVVIVAITVFYPPPPSREHTPSYNKLILDLIVY